MHLSPLIPPLVGVVFTILVLGLLLRRFGQPQLVGYILAGVVIGPQGIGWVTDAQLVDNLGSLGVVLLLFFIGMEISPRQIARGWRIAIFGTLLQVGLSVLITAALGGWLGWPMARVVLLGFVISLSSTAVVLKLLADRGELQSKAGQNVLLILLAQDLAVVPMLICLSLLGGGPTDHQELLRQVIGGTVTLAFAAWLVTREQIDLPLARHLKDDHEIQVFAALLICFGLAFVTGIFSLSAALGAFLGGILVNSAHETHWVHEALHPLRVIFVALFFVSVGMLIDIDFVRAHLPALGGLLVAVLLTNTFLNAFVIRLLGDDWRTSLYSGALLAQIGEFSFILAAVGKQGGVVSQDAYHLTVAVIAATLLVSPLWIGLWRRLLRT